MTTILSHLLAITVSIAALTTLSIGNAAQPNETAEQKVATEHFRLVSLKLTAIPTREKFEFGYLDTEEQKQLSKEIQELVRKSHLLPAALLKSDSVMEKSLACMVFAYSDRTDVVPILASYLDSHLVPGAPVFFLSKGCPATMAGWAKLALDNRFPESPSQDMKSFREWWKKIEHPQYLPSQWWMQYRRADAWGESVDPLKAALLKVPSPHRELIALSLRHYQEEEDYTRKGKMNRVYPPMPELLTREEVHQMIKAGLDGPTRRKMLTEDLDEQRLFGLNTINARAFEFMREYLAEHLAEFFTADDAEHIRKQAAKVLHGPALAEMLIRAAFQLDPAGTLDWLVQQIELHAARPKALYQRYGRPENDRFHGPNHAALVQLLWQLAGPARLNDVAAFFYGRGWPDTGNHRFLAFQHTFLDLLDGKLEDSEDDRPAKRAKNDDGEGNLPEARPRAPLPAPPVWGKPRPKPRPDEPVLRALIRHDKLYGLGWSSTRELALSCPGLLGEKFKSLTGDLLELDHELEPVEFDLETAKNGGKPPENGEGVLKVVREFQAALRNWEKQNR